LDRGIGIHFSAYERVDGYWIPELFHIRNWRDTSYSDLLREGVVSTRQTYGILTNDPNVGEHGRNCYRLHVHEYLQSGHWFLFNNGDPLLFNKAASAILSIMEELARRRLLVASARVETYRRLVRRPAEVVSRAQTDFCPEGNRLAGGKPHDLAVTPGGIYSSDSGD
jgi:hypothetical protein